MASQPTPHGILEVYDLPGREDAMQEKLSEALSRASRCLGHTSAMKIATVVVVGVTVSMWTIKNNKKTMVFLCVSSFPLGYVLGLGFNFGIWTTKLVVFWDDNDKIINMC